MKLLKDLIINKDAIEALEELAKDKAADKKAEEQAIEDIQYRIQYNKLKRDDASEEDFIKAARDRSQVELERGMETLRDLWQDNEALMTYITELENLERVNISKEALEQIEEVQQAIRDELEATARESLDGIYDIDDLLTARQEAIDSNDFTRAKTRTEKIIDQVADIDKQIRLQFPDFLESLDSLTAENLNTLKQEELNDISSSIGRISSFISSDTYNNVFNIPTTNNASAEEIIEAIKKYLGDNNTRFVMS